MFFCFCFFLFGQRFLDNSRADSRQMLHAGILWFHFYFSQRFKMWFNIFSDSMSSRNLSTASILTQILFKSLWRTTLSSQKNGKNIILCWILSPVGILGNEKADAAAKLALSLPVIRMKLPATGMYPRITKLIFDEWQEVWNCCAGNKLHAIRLTVCDYKQKTCLSRRDTVWGNVVSAPTQNSSALLPGYDFVALA